MGELQANQRRVHARERSKKAEAARDAARLALYPRLIAELREVHSFGTTERIPLRQQELASIAALLREAGEVEKGQG